MRRVSSLLLCTAMLTLTACGGQTAPAPTPAPEVPAPEQWEGATVLVLGDEEIGVRLGEESLQVDNRSTKREVALKNGDGETVLTIGRDIVCYEEGQDFTYGEGTEQDAHSKEEADAHTVLTIRQPGTYLLRGKLSAGQVAVDLGEEAEEDPEAVVTLVLDGVDLTCTVAPAVIFYNVYECGDKDDPTEDVDTAAAGANVVIAGGTENVVNGSYVARIYKPGTVELNKKGTEVKEAKKLHKYDGAFYSKMSMNVTCDEGDTGRLTINAENEGLDTEMHLTINGGTIRINSGNDGINTNEDGVSVTTVNGGVLSVLVTGESGEGDGIDSNGWVVINGGTVVSSACAASMDSGLDADMGIHLNGGTVIAAGNMLDEIVEEGQTYAAFRLAQPLEGGMEGVISLQREDGAEVLAWVFENSFTDLVFSSPELIPGAYTLWSGEKQLGHMGAGQGHMDFFRPMPDGFAPAGPPEGFEPGERPGPPEGFEPGARPQPPEGVEWPQGMTPPAPGGRPGDTVLVQGAMQEVFQIAAGANYFSGVQAIE